MVPCVTWLSFDVFVKWFHVTPFIIELTAQVCAYEHSIKMNNWLCVIMWGILLRMGTHLFTKWYINQRKKYTNVYAYVVYLHMCMCTWLFRLLKSALSFQSRSEVSSNAHGLFVHYSHCTKMKKKYNHNKNSISKFEVNFQKNFMNEQPNKKQNCARFLCCSCARSLDDLLCPYETCFNSCVRCYLNLFLLYIYVLFFSLRSCANIYWIPKARLKMFVEVLFFCWRNLHVFSRWRCMNKCANCDKNGNCNFPMELEKKNPYKCTHTHTNVHAHKMRQNARESCGRMQNHCYRKKMV